MSNLNFNFTEVATPGQCNGMVKVQECLDFIDKAMYPEYGVLIMAIVFTLVPLVAILLSDVKDKWNYAGFMIMTIITICAFMVRFYLLNV